MKIRKLRGRKKVLQNRPLNLILCHSYIVIDNGSRPNGATSLRIIAANLTLKMQHFAYRHLHWVLCCFTVAGPWLNGAPTLRIKTLNLTIKTKHFAYQQHLHWVLFCFSVAGPRLNGSTTLRIITVNLKIKNATFCIPTSALNVILLFSSWT